MGNSVEFQVTLGLKSAQAQIENLGKILEQAVKPDTKAFSSISQALEKLQERSVKLSESMKDSFKTSSGSKKFLAQYEALFKDITSIQKKFTSFKLGELLLSKEDQSLVDETFEKIKKSQKELSELQGNKKVGKIFDDDVIENADKVRDVIKELKTDSENLTFTGLSQSIEKEQKSVKDSIDKITKDIERLNKQKEQLDDGKFTTITEKVSTVLSGATKKRTFKGEDIIDYSQALKDFYSSFSDYTGKQGISNIKSGGDISKFLADETSRIRDHVVQMENQYNEYKVIVDKFNAIKSDKTKTREQKAAEADELAKNAGIDVQGGLKKGERYADYINRYITSVQENMKLDPEVIRAMGSDMVKQLQGIFDQFNVNSVLDPNKIAKDLKDVFTKAGIDLGNENITKIFDSIKEGMDPASFMATLSENLKAYSAQINNDLEKTGQSVTTLQDKLKNLEAASAAVETARTSGNTKELIEARKQEIQELYNVLQDVVNKINAATGKNLKLPGFEEAGKQGGEAVNGLIQNLTKLEEKQKNLSNIQMAISRWMGFYQVLNLTKRAITSMQNHIKDLDDVMTKIAVVTNMSQEDLWGQIGKYSEIARQYGVAIKGVYEISQIYYQQGLNKGDVMNLTTETLKMARIAGIDYATAADYMTTAIRGFKLEMTDAQHVTDVFSNLAAHTASSTEELATAISKTAASAASVGSSFEATSAMMATMIATTRESATNIGTALKSIISRYGEMKENMTGVDEEGEEYSLNKVDKALQSIGISIHDANGQFRDFDDVILELAESWDKIDTNTQRYIATVMAGNRQQSRFLALVSNVEEYKRALELANDAEGVGELQTLKTLDSIDAKIERMKVTIQEFYTSSGIESLYKGVLDTITNVIDSANSLPKIFGKFPAIALGVGLSLVQTVKNVLTLIIASIQSSIELIKGKNQSTFEGLAEKIRQAFFKGAKQGSQEVQQQIDNISSGQTTTSTNNVKSSLGSTLALYGGAALKTVGSYLTLKGLNQYGESTTREQDIAAGRNTFFGVASNILGGAVSGLPYGLPGAIAGGLTALVTQIPTIVSSISMLGDSTERQIQLAEKQLDKSTTAASEKKGEYKEIDSAYIKLKQLYEAQNESAEALQEYKDYMNQLGETYPRLIEKMTASGDAIINLTTLEGELAKIRTESAKATLQQLKDELELKKKQQKAAEEAKYSADTLIAPGELSSRADELYDALFEMEVFTHPTSQRRIRATELMNQGKIEEATILLYNELVGGTSQLIPKNGDYKTLYTQELENIVSYVGNNYNVGTSNLRERVANSRRSLYNAVEEAKKNNKELNTEELIGIDLKTLKDYENLTDQQLADAINHFRIRTQELVEVSNETVQSGEKALSLGSLDVGISSYLQKNQLTGKLDKYSSLFSYIISGKYGNEIDWGSKENNPKFNQTNIEQLNQEMENLSLWVKNNEQAASDLMNLDLKQFRSKKELSNILSSDYNLPEAEQAGFIEEYQQVRKEAQGQLYDALKKYLPDITDRSIFRELTNNIGKKEINTQYYSILQSQLAKYDKLKSQGYTITAENYLDGLKQIYSYLGNLTSEEQSSIFDIISTADLNDYESLANISEQLTDMGFTDLAEQFTKASQRVFTNVQVQAISLSDKLKDMVKETEKVSEKLGKGMKYSDALEIAQKIYEKIPDTKLSFNDMIQYDEELGEYIITTQGIQEWINSIQGDTAEQIEKINNNADRQKIALDVIQSSNINNQKVVDSYANLSLEEWNKRSENLISYNFSKQFREATTGMGLTEEQYQAYDKWAQDLLAGYRNRTDKTQTWDKYLQDQQDAFENLNTKELEILRAAGKNSILSMVASYDFSAIAGGTAHKDAKANLQLLLTEAGIKDFDIDTIWYQLINGQFDALNTALEDSGIQIGKSIQQGAVQSNIEKYKSAIKEWQTFGEDQTKWSKQAQDLFSQGHWEENQFGDAIWIRDFSTNVDEAIEQAYQYLEGKIDEVNYTTEQYNNDILGLWKNKGLGKTKAGVDLVSGGFTLDEFQNYINSFVDTQAKINDYFNPDTKQFDRFINDIDLNTLFSYDELTDSFKLNAEITQDAFVSGILAVFGGTRDKVISLYNELFSNEITKKIQDLDAADVGKKAASQIKTLSSATVGTRVDVSGLSEEIQQSLGATDGWIQIVSEYQRDQLLMTLDPNAYNEEYKQVVKEIQDQIKQKRSKGAGLQGIISKSFTKDVAKNFISSMGYDSEEVDVNEWMRIFGFDWDEYSQTFRATKQALNSIRYRISLAKKPDSGASEEYIAELETLANQLEIDLAQNPAELALRGLLSNYTNAESQIAAFKTYFGNKVNIDDYIYKDIDGNTVVKVNELQEALGEEYSKYFDTTINQITDQYFDNIDKVMSFITSGTKSSTEMAAFQRSYKEITGKDVQFYYNEVLEAWSINPSILKTYYTNYAQKVNNLTQEDAIKWAEDQIKSQIIDTVDFKSFYSARNKGQNSKAYKTLRNSLYNSISAQYQEKSENYLDYLTEDQYNNNEAILAADYAAKKAKEENKTIREEREKLLANLDNNMSIISGGGKEAVAAMKEIMPDHEFTKEEIEAAYTTQTSPIMELFDTLESLEEGSIVEEDQIETLKKAGFEFDGTIVTKVASDLVSAYESLYDSLADTGEATISQLNKAAKQTLNAKYKKLSQVSSTLSKGTFTIDELIQMYEQAGIQFGIGEGHEGIQKRLDSLSQYIDIDTIGNVHVKDFAGLAAEFGWEEGTNEYWAAYQASIDARISEADNYDRAKKAASQISNVSGAKIGDRINVSEIGKLLNVTGEWVIIQSEAQIDAYIDQLESYLRDEAWVAANPQQAAAIQTAISTWKTKFNKNEAWQSAIAEKVQYSAAETLMAAYGVTGDVTQFMTKLGFNWDEYTKEFIATEDTVAKIRQKIASDTMSEEARNSLNALIDNLEDQQKYKGITALQDVLTNFTSVTNEQIAAFNSVYENIDLRNFITRDITGKQKVNIPLLRAALKERLGDKFTDGISEIFNEAITTIMDENLGQITSATNLVISGTTNTADMQQFLKNYKEVTGKTLDNAFNYNEVLDAWQLDSKVLGEFIQAQGQQLVSLGLLAPEQLSKYITDNTQKKLAENINISEFLSAENKGAGGQAYRTLENSLMTYIESSDELFNRLQKEYINAQLVEEGSTVTSKAIADFYIKQIKEGGTQAIAIMQAVAEAQGKELSASDIEAAYRVQVSGLENALDQLTYGVGSLVSGDAVQILTDAGYALQSIGGGSAVITSIGKITDAYQAYYNTLAQSGEATLAALNEAKARVLETQNGRAAEQMAIEALGDASGMTYTRFASIFTDAGIELTDDIMNQLTKDGIIEAMGGNKMRIKDFARFAEAMNWDYNSEEYISAFKTYNDSLIELNKKVEQGITDEVKSLKDAKGGEQINLTNLYSALEKQIIKPGATDINGHELKSYNPLLDIQTALLQYGATLKDGILTLTDNADLYNIAKVLKDASQTAGVEIGAGLQALEDTIKDIIKSYVTLIQGGIKGTLTGAEKLDLSQKATSWGIFNLDFSETTEGFKLSEQSAISLYNKLKEIDGIQASLVFNDLKESLEATNENFSSVSSLMNYIVNTRQLLNSADANVSDARLSQYQAELSIAQEILAVRSTQEDSAFNFMSNKIPAAQNNPLNYAKNWSQALQTFRDAFKTSSGTKNGKTGFMDYTDWYNIVTEMNNIATKEAPIILSDAIKLDGTLKAASDAIQAGADSLTAVDTGDIKVNLGAIGIGIESGAAAMQDSVTKGIQSAAQSQVEMLDGLIAMLEIIVAMEQLGDITGEDTQIDLGDIFVIPPDTDETIANLTEFTDQFDKGRKKLLEYIHSNEDLETQFANSSVKLGEKMFSMLDLFGDNQSKQQLFNNLFGDITDEKQKKEVQKAYQTMINGLYQAAISGDYDLDDIAASFQKIAKENKINLSDFVFNIVEDGKIKKTVTFIGETAVEFDYSDEEVRKAVDNYFNNNTNYKQSQEDYTAFIQDTVNKYKTGKDGDHTITKDEKINLRTILGIASNEFVLSKDKEGNFTGYYNGKKFYGKDQNKILQLMGEAAALTDEGFDFTVELDNDKVSSKAIKGKTTLSGLEIEVYFDESGNIVYKYGTTEGSKEKILGKIAEEGKQEEVGTYNFEGKTITVQKIAELSFTYSYYVDKNGEHYKFEGHDFGDNYDQMYDYMAAKKTWDPGNKFSKPLEGKETATISYNEKLKVQINLTEDGVETVFILDGQEIGTDLDQNAVQKYIEALNNYQKFEDTSSNGAKIRQTSFRLEGNYLIQAQFNLETGEVTYSYSYGGNQYTANNLDDLKAIIGTLQEKDLSGNTGETRTITIVDEAKIEHKIEITDTGLSKEGIADLKNNLGWTDDQIEKLNQKLTTTSTNTITASVAIDPESKEAAEKEAADMKAQVTVTIPTPDTSPISAAVEALELRKVVQLVPDASALNGDTKIQLGSGTNSAKGNVALAAGTLMGELGPELVVSNGRYFVVGQNGAEFVNLDPDAIVFNHQQTASLLKNGKSGRGKPITNETNAVSFAKGNVNGGPAMAGASAALAALKQLRAQWQALAQLSAKDLAGAGGGGGGGGGGAKAFTKELERWYNWLQEIARLEYDINQYEAERNTIQSAWVKNGYEYFNSQLKTLDALKQQLSIQADLVDSQTAYFNKRRAEINTNNGPFSSLYTFDDYGQLKYKNGKFEQLSNMVGTDKYNNPNMTPKEQYDYIVNTLGIDKKYLMYDKSGNEIKFKDGKPQDDAAYASAIQAFWDKIDADKDEMQNLFDDIAEGNKTLEELQKQQNEILQSMRDNQMDVEQKVYDAIVDMRQRMIDELQDTKDAIKDANDKYIEGLNNALQKERDMYDNAESREELDKLIRKRDVLVRSGGSAAEISSLNEQIEDMQMDTYFDKQQEQIDAIQEASDKQIEKLEAQIKLETELLDYQKKYGLLWSQVTEIMSKSPEEIAKFIAENDSEYWNKSPVATQQAMNELRFVSEQWASYRDNGALENDLTAIKDALTKKDTDNGDKDKKTKTDGDGKNPGGGGGGGKNPGGNGKSTDKSQIKDGEPSAWKSNATYHWKEQKYKDGHIEVVDKGEHEWVTTNNGATTICSVCKRNARDTTVNQLPDEGKTSTTTTQNNPPTNSNIPNDPKAHGVQYKVVGFYPDGTTRYSSGLFGSYDSAAAYRDALLAKGYNVGIEDQSKNKESASATNMSTSITSEAVKELANNALNTTIDNNAQLATLSNLRSQFYNAVSSVNNSNTQSVTIDKVDVNLNVDKLANNYDSRQAARTVMDEIVHIASKTSANNSVRR